MKPARHLALLPALVVPLVACGDDGAAGPTTTETTPAELVIDNTSLGFGGVALGGVSAALTLEIRNQGGARSSIPELTLTGDDAAAFHVERNYCDASLEPRRSCSLVLLFRPQHTGAASAVLAIDAPLGGHYRVPLGGEGLDAGNLVLEQRGEDLGGVVVGTTSAERVAFAIENTGGVPTGALRVSGVTPDFVLTDGCSDAPLPPGGTCLVEVAFAPRSLGDKAFTLVVRATPGGAVSGRVRGVGLAMADVSVDTEDLDLGTTAVGATVSGEIVVTNHGGIATGPLGLSVTGASPEAFVVEGCRGEAIGAGDACTIVVSFSPKTPGTRTAQVRLVANPGGQTLTALTARAVATLIDLTPDDGAFDDTTLGAESAAAHYTVKNLSDRASGALELRLAGADGDAFRVAADTCSGASLPAGDRCTFELVFAPLTRGDNTAELVVASVDAGLARLALEGRALAPAELAVDLDGAPAVDFGGWAKGSITDTRDVIVTNAGDQPTSSVGLALTGADAGAFRIVSHTCLNRLYPGESCVARVAFAPPALGDFAAALTVDADTGGHVDVPLTGVGVSGDQLVVAPTELTFDALAVGDRAVLHVVVTNDSEAPTGDFSIFKTGVAAADYSLAHDCGPLAPHEACTITVGFSPRAEGLREAGLNVIATPGGTLFVPLAGSATVAR